MTCRYCAPDGHDPVTPVAESWKARVAELEAEHDAAQPEMDELADMAQRYFAEHGGTWSNGSRRP